MCLTVRFLVSFVVILSAASGLAEVMDKNWDFEKGIDGWQARGLPKGITAEVVSRMVSSSTDMPHQGRQCLLVRDELDDVNPYAGLAAALAVEPGKKYVFRGWIRTTDKDHPRAEAGIEAEGGGKVAWLAVTRIPVSEEWQEFVIIADKIPPGTKTLRPTVFVFASPERYDRTRKGLIYLDDLRFSEYTVSQVDLTKAANAGYKDETAGDGIGGWTDQGDNDARNLKPGALPGSPIQFTLIDPAKNNGKSVISISNQSKFFTTSADVPLAAKFDWLYLLHTAAWTSDKALAGTLIFNYQDGTSSKIAITCGALVGDWWGGNAANAAVLPMRDVCPQKNPVYLFIAPIRNPQPLKETKSITLEAAPGNVVWLVLGMTVASGENTLETSISAKRDYRQWFNFDINNRKSPKNALVDLSLLLDAPAGKHGFLQSKNGHFVFADGTPGRFFGTNIHAVYTLDPTAEQAEAIADTLARYGLNIVRFHLAETVLARSPRPWMRKCLDDPKFLDRFDYFVKCLKDKGIYILLDSVTGLSSRYLMPDSKVPNYDMYHPCHPWAYYENTLIQAARDYMKFMLTRPNKYTGRTLLDEPAVAMVMLFNEQSIFFELAVARKNHPEYYNKLLNSLFSEFLLKKYGSREKLAQAWTVSGNCDLKADEDPAKGNVRPMQLEDFYSPPPDGAGLLRHKDSVEFLKVTQVKYYSAMQKYLVELGCKVPIGGTNIVYDVPELETHLTLDYTAQNVYHDEPTDGKTYNMHNLPLVKVDLLRGEMPTCEARIAAVKLKVLPVISTEMNAMWPHEWRSSFMISMAAMSAFQDWDATFHAHYMGGYSYDWNLADKTRIILNATVEFNDPATVGIFPAATLLYQRRDVSTARNTVQIVYQGQDLLLQHTGLRTAVFPFNYLPFVSRVESAVNAYSAPADVVLAGSRPDFGNTAPLYMQYDRFSKTAKPAASRELDAAMKKAGLLKPESGITGDSVVSDTGELTRDWKKGLITINTPRSQGITGFTGGEWITLKDVAIKSGTPFATIMVSALDKNALNQSARMLLTAVGRAENDSDTIEYGNTVKEPSGFVRGERMKVFRGKGGKVMTEIVNAEIKLKYSKVKVTPLAPDMTAAGAAYEVSAVDGVTTVTIGNKSPFSIWYLLETGN